MDEYFKIQLMEFFETLETQLRPIDNDNPDLYFIPPWMKDELKRIKGMTEEQTTE